MFGQCPCIIKKEQRMTPENYTAVSKYQVPHKNAYVFAKALIILDNLGILTPEKR